MIPVSVKRILLVPVLFSIMMASGHCASQNTSTVSLLFKQGSEAMAQANYTLAVKYFEKIKTRPSPQVYFNLGQSHLLLGEFKKANGSFLTLVTKPGWQSLAWFYLAHISLRLQRTDQALQYYQKIVDLNDTPKLVKKSRSKLTLLSNQRLSNEKVNNQYVNLLDFTRSRFIAHISFSKESNPLGISEELDIKKSSDITLQRWLWGQHKLTDTLTMNALISSQDYEKNADLDLLFTSVSLDYAYLKHSQIGAKINNIEADAIAYKQLSLYVKNSEEVSNTAFDSQITLSHFQARQSYRYLQGQRLTLQATAGRDFFDGRMTARYKILQDKRKDDTTASSFTSYSPLKQRFTLLLSHPLMNQWHVEGYSWLYHYQWPSGGHDTLERTSKGLGYGVSLHKQIVANVHIQTDIHVEKNNSLDYENTSVALSMEYRWN